MREPISSGRQDRPGRSIDGSRSPFEADEKIDRVDGEHQEGDDDQPSEGALLFHDIEMVAVGAAYPAQHLGVAVLDIFLRHQSATCVA